MRRARLAGDVLLRALLLAGRSISDAGSRRIAECRPGHCAEEGSPAWFDGVRLSEAARELSRLFASVGDEESAGVSLNVRGRIVTCLLGHSGYHVSNAMLDALSYGLRTGDHARATSLCTVMCRDFAHLVDDETIALDDRPEEDVLSLKHLDEAFRLYAQATDAMDAELRQMAERIRSALARKGK